MATVKKYISKDGKVSYHIRAYNGYDAKEKQITHRMVWTPKPNMTEKAIKKELERQKLLFEEKIKSDNLFDSSITFEKYSQIWIENNKPAQLAPKTYECYKSLLKDINAAIGNIKLVNLKSSHLQEFYNNLRESGVNRKGNYASSNNLNEYIKKKKINKTKLAKETKISSTTLNKACIVHAHISIQRKL